MPGWIGSIFKLALGAFGPSPPTERFTGLVANAVENEPFFMCLAIAVATLGSAGEVRDPAIDATKDRDRDRGRRQEAEIGTEAQTETETETGTEAETETETETEA